MSPRPPAIETSTPAGVSLTSLSIAAASRDAHFNRAGKEDASYRLDNFVRAGLCQCARFTQPFLMIAVVRAFATFINRDNRSAL